MTTSEFVRTGHIPVGSQESSASRLGLTSLASNLACLYLVHLFNYMVPFVTVPYLARIMGASGWGEYSFVESVCRYAALFIEFGFALSATREVARLRDDREACADLLGGVLGAQTSMIVLLLAAGSVWAWNSEMFHSRSALFTAGAFWAAFEGAGLMWFYQGLERNRTIATVDICTKSCGVLGVYLLVHSPADAWKVLALRGAAACLTFAVGLTLAYSRVPFRFPTPRLIASTIRNGSTMFLFRSSTALSTVANVIILGLVARPEIVGFYAGAEKVTKATIGLLTPITQALYPRIANLLHRSQDQADQVAKLGFTLMVGGGMALGAAVYFSAPFIVHVFLGKGYEPAVMVLRVLALLHPVMGINNMLGIQWMLPLRLDRAFNQIVLTGGVLNVALAATLSRWLAQLGPAWAVLSAQTLVTICLVLTLYRKKLFFTRSVAKPESTLCSL